MSNIELLSALEVLEQFKENNPDLSTVSKVLSLSEEQFVRQYAKDFGNDSRKARRAYWEAQRIQEQVTLLWGNIKDAVASLSVKDALFNNLPTTVPKTFIDHQRAIPGYTQLFGNLDFLEGEHCRSIFGPAAYFVDLMRFIERNISQNAVPEGHRLEGRQPHLFYMPLDCENTFTLVPYIDLVNEVLEDVLQAMARSQDSSPTPYEQVAAATFPPSLPFHLPLEELRLYLEQLKLKLQDIYRLFGVIEPAMVEELLPLTYRSREVDPQVLSARLQAIHELLVEVEPAIAREELLLSPQEYALVEDAIAPADLAAYYGSLALAGKGSLEDVETFIARMGLSREELNTLLFLDLSPDEVQAGLSRLFFINNTGDQQGHLEIESDVERQRFEIPMQRQTIARLEDVEDLVPALDREPLWTEKEDSVFPDTIFSDTFQPLGAVQVEVRGSRWLIFNTALQRTYAVSLRDGAIVIEDALYLRLNNNETPTWLTNEFTDQGVSLSKDTKVLVDTANLQWRVWDADNDVTYVIRRVGDELVIFDAPYDRLANLTPHKLDRIYRFLKLSRKLGWSYGDLDWALRSLQGSHMAEKVLRFDGTNDFVAVANTQDLTPKTFTLEAWVMIAEAGTHPIIANGNPDGTLTQFMFWVTPLGQLAFFTSALDDTHRWENHPKGQFLPPDHQSVPPGLQPSIPANRRGLNLTGDRSIAPGVFTHVAVTVNGITQSDPYHQLKFYINGVLDSTWSLRDPIPFTTTAAEQVINIGKDLLNDFFSGQIAEVRLWDKVRSEEDITKSRFHRFTGREEHLIGYWPLHETMGLEIADLASRQDGQGQPLRSHPGVLGGHIHHAIPVWTQGDLVLDPLPLPLSPYALHFNGRDAYVSGKLSHLTLEAFTLEAWFSVSGDQVHPLMTKGNADQSQVAYGLGLTSSRQLTFSLSNQTIITSEQVIPEDELTHVAVVVQPQAASPRINLYINGDLASTSQSLPDVESTTDPADFYLGRDFEGHYLRGTLKEVRIWAVERSAAALQATLHHQLVGTEPGLVAYWRLDDPMPDLRLVRDRTLFRSHLYPGGDPTLYQPDLHTEATLLPDPIDRQAAVLTFSADQYPVRLQNSQLLASGEYAVDPYNSQQRGLGYYEQFSLQLWFKPQPGATADEQILFTQGDRDTGLTFYLAAGKLYGYAWCTGFNGQPLLGQFAFESANLAVDQWHHLTFVYDETQRDGIEYRLYVDGERVAPLPLPEPMTTFRLDQVGPAYLGGLPAGGFTRFPNRDAATGTHSFNGQITDLRIWDIALASSAPEDLTSDRLSPPLIPPATTEHLVAYLPMTENYGRRISDHEGPAYPEEPPLPVPDQSPSEHTAILDVGPDPIDPKWQPVDNLPIFPDTVLTLSGEEQFFYLPYASELALVASSFTLELWVRLPALGSELPLVGSDRTPLQLCVTDQGQLKATWGEHELVSEAVLQANIWHHLAWRCDRPAQIHTLFIDGQPNGQPIAAAGIPEDALLYLGRHRSPSGQVTYLQGDISEVRCWSVSRDDSTIAANWNHRLTGAESDLVAYWVCDADHRLELRDRTTAAHPLQLDLRPDQDINSQWVTVTAPPTLNRQVQGLNINQSDEYVPDYIDLSTYIVRNVGTIELWMQFSRQIDQVLLDASRPDGTAPFRVEIQGQALSFRVGDTSGAATTAQIALDELAASFDEAMHRVAIAWQFEAATATTTIRLSIDEFRATAISSGSGVKPEFPHPFVGLNRTNDIAALRRYQGQITQVRVWDAMRSPLDLQRLSHADLEGGEPGLLVYLPMDEGRRTILNDLSSDHPVKFKSLSLPHPNPTWLIADYAIALNGRGNASNGRGDAIDVPFFTPGETGSLELWVKFDLEREPVLLDASTGGEKPETNKAFVISVIRNGGSRKLRFRLEDSADANFDADIDLDQRNLSEFSTRWHHLVATWRYEPQSRGAVGELFLDDLLPASIDQEESDNRTPNGEYPGFRPLYIGKNRSDYEQIAGNPLKGQVRHFRAWNRALSAAEVEQLRNAPWQGLDPAIDLPLNEGTGTALSAALSAQPATNAIATLLLQGDQQTDRWQVIDRAVEIDHPETFITCPAYVPGTSGTIELWVKFARDRNQYLLDASGEGDAVFFVDIADGQLRLRVGSSIAAIDATSFPAEFDTAWHYIAAIWKYEQQTLSLHLRLDHSEAELTSELSDFPACRSLYIGIFRGESDNLADYRTLQGQVSQLRIWDRWIEHEELRRRRHADLSGSETGLLVHLPIEAGSGHALANSTSNQDATLMYGIFPDVRWVRNPATLLQWQGDYGVLPSTAALGLADTYTLEAWVNLPNLSGTHPILGTRGPIVNAAAATWAWGIRDGSVWVQVADQELVATDLQLSADTWHHLVCQYDREMGSLRLSLDSQLSAASLEGIAPYTASRTLYLALLQRWDAIANSWERSLFRGLIAEVRIWSGDRTEADLAQGRDRRLRGDEPGLIAYWTLTDEQRHRLPATGANPHWAYLSRDLQTLNLYRAAQPPLYTPRFAPALDGYNDYLALNHTLANQPHTVEFWFADRPNQWQHLAAVYSDGGSRQLFLNGALVETPSPALEAKLYAYRMNVGDTDRPERNAQGQLNVTSGLVTDLRLWNSSRTATEIYENYQRHLTGREEHLWAYWKVDEGRGDRLRDAAENLLPATLIAGLENTADKWQPAPPPQTGSTHAIYLDGRDDHLIIGDAADLSLDQSFTVEAWVNLTEPQASGMGPILATISLGNHASDHRLVVGIDNGHPYISLRSQSVLQASQSLENGWHHLAWQFELAGDQPAQGTLRIFVDDLLIAESSGHQPFAGDGTLVIGRGQEVNSTTATVTPRYFRGGLGEIRVWRTVRTAEEIKAYRDRPLVGDVDTLAALTAYWIFDEPVTTVIPSRAIAAGTRYDLVMYSDATSGQPTWSSTLHPVWLNPLPAPSLSFDGDRQHLATTTPLPLAALPFTLEVWVKVSDWTEERAIARWGVPGSNTGFELMITTEGRVGLQIWQTLDNPGTSITPSIITTDAVMVADIFTHIALVTQTTNDNQVQIILLVNGTEQQSQTLSASLSGFSYPLIVGQGGTPETPTYFKGLIKEVRLWQGDRTADLAATLYHPLTAQEPGLLSYWPLAQVEEKGRERLTPNLVLNRPPLRLGGLLGSRKPTAGEPTQFWDSRHRVLTLSPGQALPPDMAVPGCVEASYPHRAQYTIEVWFLCRNLASGRQQVIYSEGDGDRGLSIYIQSGTLYLSGWNHPIEESYWQGSTISTNRLQANHWHHVALILNGKDELRDDAFRALLDGRAIDTRPGSQLWGLNRTFTIGGLTITPETQPSIQAVTGTPSFDGQIREVRVWATVRTDDQIRNTRYALPDGDRQNLLFYWDTTNLTGDWVAPMELPDPMEAAISSPALPLIDLAYLRQLQAEWKQPVERLCALWIPMRHIGRGDRRTLFDSVFNPPGTEPYWSYSQRLVWEIDSDEPPQRQIRTRLLSTLRRSQADLQIMVRAISGEDAHRIVLDGAYLTLLYRFNLLAGLLRLSMADLVGLIAQLQRETAASEAPLHDLANFTLRDVRLLKERADWMRRAGITLAEYEFLVDDIQSQDIGLPYTEAMVIDTATILLNQSSELLVNNRSLATDSPTISDAAADKIYRELKDRKIIDELALEMLTPTGDSRSVSLGIISPDVLAFQLADPALKELQRAILLAVAEALNWATSFDGNELGVSKQALIEEGIIEADPNRPAGTTGLILKPIAPNPDRPAAEQVLLRDLVTNRLDLQVSIPNEVITRLQDLRRAFDATLLNDFATLLDTDAERLLDTMQNTSGQLYTRGVWDIPALMQQLSEIANQQTLATDSPLAQDLRQLSKVLILLDQFSLSEQETQLLLTQSNSLFGIQPERLFKPTLADLQRLHTFEQLKRAWGDRPDSLISVLQEQTPLHEFTGWRQADILKVAERLQIPAGTYHTIPAIERLHRAFGVLGKLGSDPAYLFELADTSKFRWPDSGDRSFAIYQKLAATLFDLVRAQYSEDQWPKAYKPLHDRLAVQKRDALTALILEVLGGQLGDRKTPNILYEYLLIDVQTGSAVETSRIVQGIASLQLYVQRCLMNLEHGVNPEQIPMNEWEWMKNYRVWEANRKVFLYPENYIEPELRDTKTPLFEELQDSLQQGNITAETVANAYTNYLNQFAQVANLTIVGSYYDTSASPRTGHALTFDGKGFIEVSSIDPKAGTLIPQNAATDTTDPSFTIELWVKSTLPGSQRGGIASAYNWGFPNNQSNGGWILEVDRSHFRFHVVTESAVTESANGNYFQSIATSFSPDEWYHLAVTYDSNNNNDSSVRLYLNGEEKGSINCSGKIVYPQNLTPEQQSEIHFVLGTRKDLDYEVNFAGQMREIRIWSTARSPEQIRLTMFREIKNVDRDLPQDERSTLLRCWNRDDTETNNTQDEGLTVKDFSASQENLSTANNRIRWKTTPLIEAIYQDEIDEDTILYLIGRDDTTQEYYIRELINQRRWTPWRKLGITINAQFVSPVFAFNRLFLFWAEIQDHVRSEPRRRIGTNGGKPIDQLGDEIILKTNDPDGSTINRRTNIVSNKLDVIEFVNLPLKRPVLKFSFVNFSQEWIEPQTVNLSSSGLKDKELSEWERLQPKWLRVYAQRWRGSDVAPLVQRLPEPIDKLWVTQLDTSSYLRVQVPNFSTRELTFSFWLRVNRLQSETTTSKEKPRVDTFTLVRYGNSSNSRIQMQLTHKPTTIGENLQLLEAVEQSQAAITAVHQAWQLILTLLNTPTSENLNSLTTHDSSLELLEEAVGNALDAIKSNTNNPRTLLANDVLARLRETRQVIDELAKLDPLENILSVDLASEAASMAEKALSMAERIQSILPTLEITSISTNQKRAEDARSEASNTDDPDEVATFTKNAIQAAIDCLDDSSGIGSLLTSIVTEEEKTEKWNRGTPQLIFQLGAQSPLQVNGTDTSSRTALVEAPSLPNHKWLHISLTLSDRSDFASFRVYDKEADTDLFSSNFPSLTVQIPEPEETLLIGAEDNPSSIAEQDGQFQPQMSEFRLWDMLRDDETIENERYERKHGKEPGLQVHLPLDTSSFNDVDIIQVDASGTLELNQTFPLELLNSDRERIVLLYGDQAFTLRNTLKDTGFSYNLKVNENALPNYDISLSIQEQNQVGVVGQETEARINAEKYSTNKILPLDRFLPEARRAVLENEITVPKPSEITTAETEWTSNSNNQRLLANSGDTQLDIAASYIMDVHNQPGWCVVDIGDQVFLVKINIDQLRLLTAEERLRANPADDQPTVGAGQAFDLRYDRDRTLEVRDGVIPRFEFIRLNTFAVQTLNESLLGGGIPGLLSIDSQSVEEPDFSKLADLSSRQIVAPRYRYDGSLDNRIDFYGAYGIYYREIFFHIPLLIANQLNADQRFAEAQEWYHYIFNPTAQEPSSSPAYNSKDRYWRYRAFRNLSLETISELLSDETALDAYREDPFDPHAIAALRINTYQKTVVMKYINNLLDWGDSLFRRDTREAINEATQLYVLAYTLMGDRPTSKPAPAPEQIGSYRDIEKDLGRALVNPVPPDFLVPTLGERNGHQPKAIPFDPNRTVTTRFGVPANDYFIGFWDRIDDRLFKIRNSLNIDGVFRSLSLFEPPIDPAALVRAAAGGNLSSAISSATAGNAVFTPHYRYSVMLEQAKAYTDLVTDFGDALLDAINNRDDAALAQIESNHERVLLEQTTDIKKWAIAETEASIRELEFSRLEAEHRYNFFDTEMNKTDPFGMSEMEVSAITLKTAQAALEKVVAVKEAIAAAAATVVIEVEGGGSGIGGSPVATVKSSGGHVSKPLEKAADVSEHLGWVLGFTGDILEKLAEYENRSKEWERDRTSAEYDQDQIREQLDQAQQQLLTAQRELNNHLLEIDHNQEIADFNRRKFANRDLYNWMVNRLSTLYFEAYRLAYDLAKQAERAYQFEFATNDTYINFGYWDNRRRGLLAGEALKLDLARLEKASLDQDSRYMEITKTISLSRINPIAFLELRKTGRCQFSLDEMLFARDFPGHYFRVIKSLSISVPAVVGPYQTVNAMLTQTGHKTLLAPDISGVKYMMGLSTDRPESVRVNWRANQQIAISTAIEDSGVFELDFNDDRYLPFENTGVVSNWLLEIPKDTNFFDYDTITDVILHLRYLSVPDSGSFRDEVRNDSDIDFKTYRGARLFNIAQEFSAQWHAFTTTSENTLRLPIPPSTFPPNVDLAPLNEEAITAIYGFTTEDEVKVEDMKGSFEVSIDSPRSQPGTYIMNLSTNEDIKKHTDLLMVVLSYEGKLKTY